MVDPASMEEHFYFFRDAYVYLEDLGRHCCGLICMFYILSLKIGPAVEPSVGTLTPSSPAATSFPVPLPYNTGLQP